MSDFHRPVCSPSSPNRFEPRAPGAWPLSDALIELLDDAEEAESDIEAITASLVTNDLWPDSIEYLDRAVDVLAKRMCEARNILNEDDTGAGVISWNPRAFALGEFLPVGIDDYNFRHVVFDILVEFGAMAPLAPGSDKNGTAEYACSCCGRSCPRPHRRHPSSITRNPLTWRSSSR